MWTDFDLGSVDLTIELCVEESGTSHQGYSFEELDSGVQRDEVSHRTIKTHDIISGSDE